MTDLPHTPPREARSIAEPSIDTAVIPTARAATCVRWLAGRDRSEPVILLHGNVSSSVFFFPLMSHLPRRFRPIALDLRGFGGSDPEPVDASRGVRDFSDDVLAAMDALDVPRAHLVGWSLGGAVAMQAAVDAPQRFSSMTVIAPISPYGFGGTTDAAGTMLASDGAGSGAGLVGRKFLQALADGDSSADNRSGPRALLRRFYVAPGWDRDGEEELVAAMMSTAVGPDNYPGDAVTSAAWPFFAPGSRGVMNAIAPTNLRLDALADIAPKPPILWIRGDADVVISDASAMDAAAPGRTDAIAGYPGAQAAPPQPMLAQTRAVLDTYRRSGGDYREVVVPGAGHAPHLENLPMVLEALVPLLDGATKE